MSYRSFMTHGLRFSALLLVGLGLLGAAGCKKREVPSELVGSYTRSGDVPADLRAELSIARGGMVLTVMRLSASVDLGTLGSLLPGNGRATASADLGRGVVSARTFRSLACEGSLCRFELAPEGALEACSGSFEKVQNTIIVIAAAPCQPYSGRWTLLEGLPADAGVAPPPGGSGAPSATPGLEFPPDIPQPHDHMSCLAACSIVDTRCHRTSRGVDHDAFLACVEKTQICRAKCEQVWPFFGR
jgi:hypothetical protein